MGYIKDSVVTIRRKDLDKFWGQFRKSTVWFNIDVEFLKNLRIIQNSIKRIEKGIEDQDTKLYKTVFVPFDKESIKTKNVTNRPNFITQSEAPSPEK